MVDRVSKIGNQSLHSAIQERADDESLGCSSSQSWRWKDKMMEMYFDNCKHLLRGCFHFNFVADPGHHSYKECLVSLMYCHEVNSGCFPPWQELKAGQRMHEGEVDMLDNIAQLEADNQLERGPTDRTNYRYLQA